MSWNNYKDVSWNANDLVSAKQGCCILINEGATWEELSQLDFGNLDVAEVWDELHTKSLYHYDGDESYAGYTLDELYDMDEYEV